MTVPSTEELQWLLDAATPGEWQFQDHEEWEHVAGPEYPPQQVMIAHGVEVDGVALFGRSNDDLLEDYPGNLRIAALAPVLAAEVIRLREENERMQERVNKHAQDALRLTKFLYDHHPVVHAEFKANLTRILEGDQA
ncbi:hypothetical protein [Corynebacterium dentalis]|uniref:hypothetical protein n=1 Tax=Corynebacterium dentalis TaxID=2014528 RepID=UPI002897410C|nr:hypothetical protein [Corynebacterium dentalis]